MAVKNHDVRPNHALAVINGDTLYSSFDDVIPATHDAGEIVFSCSFEVVDRAGAIIIDPVTNRMSIKKNRAGGEDGQDWVTNGTLVIGSDVFSYLQGLLVNRAIALKICSSACRDTTISTHGFINPKRILSISACPMFFSMPQDCSKH